MIGNAGSSASGFAPECDERKENGVGGFGEPMVEGVENDSGSGVYGRERMSALRLGYRRTPSRASFPLTA